VFNFAWRKGLAIHMQIIKHKSQTWIKRYFEKKSRDEGSRKDWFSQTFIEKNGEGFDAR